MRFYIDLEDFLNEKRVKLITLNSKNTSIKEIVEKLRSL
jgi:hypothetical protein